MILKKEVILNKQEKEKIEKEKYRFKKYLSRLILDQNGQFLFKRPKHQDIYSTKAKFD